MDTYNKYNALTLHPDSKEPNQADNNDNNSRCYQESRRGEEVVWWQQTDVAGTCDLEVRSYHEHRNAHNLQQ